MCIVTMKYILSILNQILLGNMTGLGRNIGFVLLNKNAKYFNPVSRHPVEFMFLS